MNNFFTNLLNKMININNTTNPRPVNYYVFGSIVSGNYTSLKETNYDRHPTVLCLGSFMNKNGQWMIHGIQLHTLGDYNIRYLLTLANNIKRNGLVTNPRIFYNYLKFNNSTILDSYRTYFLSQAQFRTISPGFSNVLLENCYPVEDNRDYWIKQFNNISRPKIIADISNAVNNAANYISQGVDEMKKSITEAINTRKVW